jgi:hypothetical protein
MTIAVEVTYRGPGATADAYRKILSEAGITPGGSHPDPECLFHWASVIPGGFRVIDVWTSRENGTRSRRVGFLPGWATTRRSSTTS